MALLVRSCPCYQAKTTMCNHTRRHQMSPSKARPASPLYGRLWSVESDPDSDSTMVELDPPPPYHLAVEMADQLERNDPSQNNNQTNNPTNNQNNKAKYAYEGGKANTAVRTLKYFPDGAIDPSLTTVAMNARGFDLRDDDSWDRCKEAREPTPHTTDNSRR